MVKTIIKEIAIVLLLIVAIGLILAIVFYDYMPTNKIVPANVVAYQMPNEIQEELKNSTVDETQNIVKTYVVTSTDLGVYESNENYKKRKENPFAISSDYKSNVIISTNLIEDEEPKYKGK